MPEYEMILVDKNGTFYKKRYNKKPLKKPKGIFEMYTYQNYCRKTMPNCKMFDDFDEWMNN